MHRQQGALLGLLCASLSHGATAESGWDCAYTGPKGLPELIRYSRTADPKVIQASPDGITYHILTENDAGLIAADGIANTDFGIVATVVAINKTTGAYTNAFIVTEQTANRRNVQVNGRCQGF